MASILRTHYNLKLYYSEDVSYNLGKMGLWTYAEIAIGIIVSCLPVLPRFFQHFGPKIRWSQSSRYRTSSNLRDSTGKARSSSKNPTAFVKLSAGKNSHDSWMDSSHTTMPTTGDHFALEDFGESSWEISKPIGPFDNSESKSEGTATVRGDLEGGRTFRI